MARTKRPTQSRTENIDGGAVTVRVFDGSPEYASRIEVDADDTWLFGIDAEGVPTPLSTTAATELGEDTDPPTWILNLLANHAGIHVDELGAA